MEEQESEYSVDQENHEQIGHLTQAVAQALHVSGFLGKIKANLRSKVYDIIHGNDFEVKHVNPRITSLKTNSREKILIDLIREFFDFYDLCFTKSTFNCETNCEDETTRNYLESTFSREFSNESPILYQLLQPTIEENIQNTTLNFSDSFGKSDTSDQEISVGKDHDDSLNEIGKVQTSIKRTESPKKEPEKKLSILNPIDDEEEKKLEPVESPTRRTGRNKLAPIKKKKKKKRRKKKADDSSQSGGSKKVSFSRKHRIDVAPITPKKEEIPKERIEIEKKTKVEEKTETLPLKKKTIFGGGSSRGGEALTSLTGLPSLKRQFGSSKPKRDSSSDEILLGKLEDEKPKPEAKNFLKKKTYGVFSKKQVIKDEEENKRESDSDSDSDEDGGLELIGNELQKDMKKEKNLTSEISGLDSGDKTLDVGEEIDDIVDGLEGINSGEFGYDQNNSWDGLGESGDFMEGEMFENDSGGSDGEIGMEVDELDISDSEPY